MSTSYLSKFVNVVRAILAFFGASVDTRVRVSMFIIKSHRVISNAYVSACFYTRVVTYAIGLAVVAAVFSVRYGIVIRLKFHAYRDYKTNYNGLHHYLDAYYSRITVWGLGNNHFSKLLDTMFHELRHAHQHNYNKSILNNYVSDKVDYDAYYNHPAEVDARAYGAAMSAKVLGFKWKHVVLAVATVFCVLTTVSVQATTTPTVTATVHHVEDHTVDYHMSNGATMTATHDMTSSDVESYAAWADDVVTHHNQEVSNHGHDSVQSPSSSQVTSCDPESYAYQQ